MSTEQTEQVAEQTEQVAEQVVLARIAGTIDAGILKAAIVAASTDKTRWTLHAVALFPREDDRLDVQSTDSYVGFWSSEDKPRKVEGEYVLVDSTDLTDALKAVKPLTNGTYLVRVIGDSVTIDNGVSSVNLRAVYGEPPSLANIVDDAREATDALGVSWRVLDKIVKVAKALKMGDAVMFALSFNGALKPFHVRLTDDAHMVAMPARLS